MKTILRCPHCGNESSITAKMSPGEANGFHCENCSMTMSEGHVATNEGETSQTVSHDPLDEVHQKYAEGELTDLEMEQRVEEILEEEMDWDPAV